MGVSRKPAPQNRLLLQSLQQLNLTGVVDIVIRNTTNQRKIAHLAGRRREAQRGWRQAGHDCS